MKHQHTDTNLPVQAEKRAKRGRFDKRLLMPNNDK